MTNPFCSNELFYLMQLVLSSVILLLKKMTSIQQKNVTILTLYFFLCVFFSSEFSRTMYRWFWIAVANRRSFNAFTKYEIGPSIKATFRFIEKTWRTMPVCQLQLYTKSIEQFQFGNCQFSAQPDQHHTTVKHRFWYLKFNVNEKKNGTQI